MNTVPTKKLYKVQSSSIHARGVFAAHDIKKDDLILEYIGDKITKAESYRRACEREDKGKKHGSAMVYIFELNQRYDIDGNVPGNHARYINHSCDPNCESDIIRGKIWIRAIKDIKKGDELTYDYGYDLADALSHPCLCKSHNCVGYIVRENLRWRLKKMLQKKKLK